MKLKDKTLYVVTVDVPNPPELIEYNEADISITDALLNIQPTWKDEDK